jgi:hypothetical protein
VKKGPALVGRGKGTVMQCGRLGGIPLPRTFPIRGGGIGSMIGRSRAAGSARLRGRHETMI